MISKLLKYLLSLFKPETKLATPPKQLSLDDYFTSSGKYPARGMSSEITPDVRANAEELLRRVNSLLAEISRLPASVNSGFRTQLANREAGGSLTSGHLSGRAIDLADADGLLDLILSSRPELLMKYDLYLEDPEKTPGWCHLDTKVRDGGRRIFKP